MCGGVLNCVRIVRAGSTTNTEWYQYYTVNSSIMRVGDKVGLAS